MTLLTGRGQQAGVYKDITTLQNALIAADRRVELVSGERFYTSLVDSGNGILLASGVYANPLSSWKNKSALFEAVSGESYMIDATSNTVDVTLPTLTIGDVFTFHNEVTSTFKVQILNPIETIKGPVGDILPGVNVELEPSNSVQLVAKSSTILEIVGAQA